MLHIKNPPPPSNDPISVKSREIASHFSGDHGNYTTEGITYEYSVLSFMEGPMKSYIATVKSSTGKQGTAKGSSLPGSYSEAVKQIL